MDAFKTWLITAWQDALSWFGVEEQKFASFLYPIFQDAKQLVSKDLLSDVIAGVPVVAAAITGAAPEEMLALGLKAAENFIRPLLETQGVTLAETTVNTLSNTLVAQAQAGLAKTAGAA